MYHLFYLNILCWKFIILKLHLFINHYLLFGVFGFLYINFGCTILHKSDRPGERGPVSQIHRKLDFHVIKKYIFISSNS